ncbi:MAG: dimethylarginine dimethylaminohydrolase family protein [Fidelibacterota bacterium]
MIGSEADRLTRVVVCPPGKEYFSVHPSGGHNIAGSPDPRKSSEQHRKLTDTLRAFGSQVVEVKELPGHPNSVFTRDPSLCTPEGYVLLHMGLASRRGEEQWMADTLQSLGGPYLGMIDPPATVEGGDIILAGKAAFVGLSTRTDTQGVQQIKKILTSAGYDVRVVPVPKKYLHLGGAMSLVGPDRILTCLDPLDERLFRGFNLLRVPANSFMGANVIVLGENEVITHSAQRRTLDVLDQAGITVHVLNLSEFVKGRGGPSCLVLPQDRSWF